jgi:hypothetical protein
MEGYEGDDPNAFLWRAHNRATSLARRGISPKQAELETYTWSLDYESDGESGPMRDYIGDPDGKDPCREFAELQREVANWELYVLAHQVAREKLKGNPWAVFKALYVDRDRRSVRDIARDLDLTSDNFYQAKRRALGRVRKALVEEEGIEETPGRWVEKWWTEGPKTLDPVTGRPTPVFGSG